MKKILLSSIFVFASIFASFGQHTQTATGFSNTCDGYGSATQAWFFTDYFTSGGGGYDDVKLDTMKFSFGVNGASICYYVFSLLNTVDLSTANTLQFSISATGSNNADTTFTANIGAESSSARLSVNQNITLTRAYATKNITLTAATGQSLAGVSKIVITMDNTAVTGIRNGTISITGLKAGSSLTAINSSAAALVASTKLYPNPVSDQANVQLDLVTPSDVKVSLSDMMGREVMTIAQGNSMSSVTQSFSVANLQKGIYTVNYFVNGAAAKSELLMVK